MSGHDEDKATVPRTHRGSIVSGPGEPHVLAARDLIAGRYLIERFLAGGGMGEIYQAVDLELKETIALKTVRAEHLRDERTMARFKREIQLARRVTHANVFRIFDLGVHRPEIGSASGAEVVFLTMELLAGDTLDGRLRARGRMTTAAARPIVEQMVAGLAAAHRAGIIHRDLKAKNVILVASPEGERAVLVDFGLARGIGGFGGGDSVDLGGPAFGTPAYMAPEQVEGGPITPATDLYALGVVMYEMVTGTLPFLGAPLDAALERLRVPAPSPRQHAPDLDPVWERVILRCLARKPRQRFARAEDVVKALAGEPVPAPSRDRAMGRIGRRSVIAGALTVALAAAVAATYWFRHGQGNVHAHVRMRPSVAVLGFEDRSGRTDAAWISTALAEVMAADLAAGGTLRVLSNDSVARMKRDLTLGEAEALPAEALARVHRNLGADYAVLGSYRMSGAGDAGEVHVEIRLQDARSGSTLATLSESGGERDLFGIGTRAGAGLREKLGAGALSAAELRGVEAMIPTNLDTVRPYAEGLARLRAYDSGGARPLLERAVASEPSFALGHAALSLAWSRIRPERAREEAERTLELSAGLPAGVHLLVEARYCVATQQWDRATDAYRKLWDLSPDDLEYGVAMVDTAVQGSRRAEASSVMKELRALPAPAGTDPRIDLVEAELVRREDRMRAVALAERAIVKAAARELYSVIAHANYRQGTTYRALFDWQRASGAYREAARGYARIGNRFSQAMSLRHSGVLLHVQGARAESRRRLDEALAIFRDLDDQAGCATTLGGIAEGLLAEGDLDGARRSFEEALAITRELSWEIHPNEADQMSRLSVVLYEQAEYSRATRFTEEVGVLQRNDLERHRLFPWIALADIQLDQGDPIAARKVLEEARATARVEGRLPEAEESAYRLGIIADARGDVATASRELTSVLSVKKAHPHRWDAARVQMTLSSIAVDQGRPAEAESDAREAAHVFAEHGRLNDEVWAKGVLARSLLAQGRTAEARAVVDDATTRWETQCNARSGFVLTPVAARVRAASGNSDDIAAAIASLEAMIADTDRRGAVLFGLEARLALGEVEVAAGRVAAGRARLETVEVDAAKRGFGRIARMASAARR